MVYICYYLCFHIFYLKRNFLMQNFFKIVLDYYFFKTQMQQFGERRCSITEILTKFTGKYLYQNLYLNKVPAWRHATLLKQKLWHSCFSVIFVKSLRTPILQNICERLLLKKENLLYICIFLYRKAGFFVTLNICSKKNYEVMLTFSKSLRTPILQNI